MPMFDLFNLCFLWTYTRPFCFTIALGYDIIRLFMYKKEVAFL